ncbi:MAG: hypothetical protein AAF725_16740 [Acidobacteriota bacterium]
MAEAPLLDSTSAGRFDVLATLRRFSGGGALLRVRDRRDGSIKILEKLPGAPSDDAWRRARETLGVRHPALATPESLERAGDGLLALRAELDGLDLESILESAAPIPPAWACELAHRALEALSALHGAGRFVRNLEPADLVLLRAKEDPSTGAAGRLVLTDLGLRHTPASEQAASSAAAFAGQLRYASPEQFDDESRIGPASDLYALGLILYLAATGRFPVAGDSPSSLIAGHLFKPPAPFEPSDEVPEALAAWILRLLSKDSAERGTAASCLEALKALRPALGAPDPAWATRALGSPESAAEEAPDALDLEPIERALEEGELTAARRLFESAAARRPGGDAALDEISRRLAAVESFTRAADVHRLVDAAQNRLEGGAPAAAVSHLEEARRLVPGDPEVARLLEHARRAAQNAATAVGGPTAMLHHVRSAVDAEIADREKRDEKRRESESRQTAELLERARALAQREDFEAARQTLESLLGLSPDHAEALALRASVDACLRIQREEAEERSEALETVTAIRGLIEQGRPEEAHASLERAETRFGDQDVLQTARFDLTKARLDAAVVQTVRLSPEDLQAAVAAETARLAAQNPEQEPRAGQSPEVPTHTVGLPPELLQEVSGRRPPDSSTRPLPPPPPPVPRAPQAPADSAAGAAVGGDVRSQAGAGSVTLPMATIEAAKKRALELRTGSQERAQGSPPPPQAPEAQALPASPPAPDPSSGPQAGPAGSPEPAPEAPALDLGELGFGGGGSSSPGPSGPGALGSGGSGSSGLSSSGYGSSGTRTQTRAAPPGRGPSKPLLAIGMLAALAAVFAASYVLSGRLDSAPVENTAAPEALELPSGVLVIDAAPWAEIVSLVDAGGQEVTLVGSRHTPKRLELPPGTYTLTLEHPPSGETQRATLALESEQVQTIRGAFEMTVDQFFRQAGW